jgi:ATP-dependent protease ClpP protease subunit
MSVKKKTELEQLINDIHSYHLNYHTRDIYLHSCWGDDEDGFERGVDYRMATTFVKNLHVLLNQNAEAPILVHMHSVGGEWNDGMAMFNAIRFSTAPVSILAYAQASSMTGILLQAADYRIITPDCEFMIHHGSIALSDTSMAVKSAIDVNERSCKRMLDIFARRAKTGKFFKERGYNETKIRAYIDRKIKDKGDWFLNAEEAIYMGFADGILGTAGHETPDQLRIYEKFKGKL